MENVVKNMNTRVERDFQVRRPRVVYKLHRKPDRFKIINRNWRKSGDS
jgi:hypothetical protein